jgi:CheY-like chemotaxis protein
MTDVLGKAKVDRRPRVLCVDDEPAVLDSLRRQLYAEFAVVGAESGPEALALLRGDASFAVLVSDMRMPGMDGAAVLAQALSVRPDTVRILLTGQADMEDAIAAVNYGHVFRFLIKPCPRPVLVKALTDAVDQHRTIRAERALVEGTLRGSVAALFEVLSLANPMAFARAARVQGIVLQMIEATRPPDAWRIEIAGMLSQIGTIVLAPETVSKLNVGSPLSPEEQLQVNVLPRHAESLLAPIPRLEDVRKMIRDQTIPYQQQCRQSHPTTGDHSGAAPEERTNVATGAQMLRIAVDLEALEASGIHRRVALGALERRKGAYDPYLLDALLQTAEPESIDPDVLQLLANELRAGMTVVRDVTDSAGRLLVGRGYQVTESLIERIRNWRETTIISEPIYVNADAVTISSEAVGTKDGSPEL